MEKARGMETHKKYSECLDCIVLKMHAHLFTLPFIMEACAASFGNANRYDVLEILS